MLTHSAASNAMDLPLINESRFVNASAIATALLGNSIAANMFMLGVAYQLGYVPLSAAALEEAIDAAVARYDHRLTKPVAQPGRAA